MKAPPWEELVARAIRTKDPVAALRRGARSLPTRQARGLLAADPDGIRITALLVARQRVERLLRGSLDARRWYESDLEGFTRAFRAYHQEVAPTAFFPPDEARLFREWSSAAARRLTGPRKRRRPRSG